MLDNKLNTFGDIISNYEYVKPYYLLKKGDIKLIKATVKGSTMVWNIEGKEISYNQIKYYARTTKKQR